MVNEPALTQLHDIHLPPAISWWPLAPGWYVLATVLLIIGSAGFVWLYRHTKHTRPKRHALRLLSNIERDYLCDGDSQLASARLSELLRRVALAYYPRTKVASLKGKAWIAFLSTSAKGIDFQPVFEQLTELPYRRKHEQNIQRLFQVTRQWIKRQGRACSN